MKIFTTNEMFTRKMTYILKKNMEKLSRFFSSQIVAHKIRTEFVFLDIITEPAFITHSSVILTLKGISYISMVSCKFFSWLFKFFFQSDFLICENLLDVSLVSNTPSKKNNIPLNNCWLLIYIIIRYWMTVWFCLSVHSL